MGVDFLKSKCKESAKGWDVERVESARNRFLTAGSDSLASGVVAKTIGPHNFHVGDEVLVRADSGGVSILVDLAPTAVLVEPSPAIVNAIRESGGYARGTVEAAYPTLDLLRVQIR